jgi:hypothetical protein
MSEFEIPLKTVAGLNAREHWRTRAARVKKERNTAKICARVLMLRVPLPATITMTRLSAGELDDDNLQGAFKAVRDGIADAYGVADNDPRIKFRYAQAKCPRGQYGIHVKADPA